VVDRSVPLEMSVDVYRRMAANEQAGKLVIEVTA
jgi:hypothetical protein